MRIEGGAVRSVSDGEKRQQETEGDSVRPV